MPDLPPPPQPDAPWRAVLAAVVARVGAPRLIAATAVIAVVAAVAGAVLLRGGSPDPVELHLPRVGEPQATAGASTRDGGSTSGGAGGQPTTAAEVVAQAAGAVVHPGVYKLPPGSRVADLVQAAGGPTDAAELDRLNLAALVQDGSRIYVPRAGETVPPGELGDPAAAGGAGGPGRGAPVDLNAATLEQLEALTGIGPSTAQAILQERQKRGRFRSVDDLLDIRGIGPAKLAAIRDEVRV